MIKAAIMGLSRGRIGRDGRPKHTAYAIREDAIWILYPHCVGCEQFYLPADLSGGRCPECGTELGTRRREELVLRPPDR
jgi:hypothetical protein